MKKSKSIPIILLISSALFVLGQFPVLKGPYMGQTPPGMTKQVFLAGLISSGAPEGCICFSHDGNYAVFRRGWNEETEVFLLEYENGEWTAPVRAPFFMKQYRFGDFTFAPNELKLYFTSDRPEKSGAVKAESSNIWMVENRNGQWLEPTLIGPPISSPLHESYPSVSSDKTLVFFRRFGGEDGASEIMTAIYEGGKYSDPVRLGTTVNTRWDEWDPVLSADGKILLFCSKKPEGMGADDLYVSFRNESGKWSEAINLGKAVNSERSENRPFITADGKYLFFSSDAGGNRDIYWISMEYVYDLNPFK